MKFQSPWRACAELEATKLREELRRETSPEHPLFERVLVAVARREDNDDVLFQAQTAEFAYAVVHLTWSANPELSSDWPWWTPIPNDNALIELMERDARS